jgi:hypothetical protein
MASVVADMRCGPTDPRHCNYGAEETVVGNVVTIAFFAYINFFGAADHSSGLVTLNETLVTDSLGGPAARFVGGVNLTFWAGVIGTATAGGQLGTGFPGIACSATDVQISPHTHAVPAY